MKKEFYLVMILLLAGYLGSFAQQLYPTTLSSGGGSYTNGSLMLEFAVGEFASITLNSTNNMLTQGTLQPDATDGTLPVTGLEFYARRLNISTVQLDWKTIQEINNKGFHIERRKENESSFVPVDFITSNAPGGNSSSPLNYVKTDANNFTGNTYYRLKQEDMDGRSTYSVVRMVKGAAGKQLAMQVWPVPSTGPVNVAVNGLTKPDVLMVLDMSGKLVKKLTMQNNMLVQLSGLARGTYLLSLAENRDLVQKIIIH